MAKKTATVAQATSSITATIQGQEYTLCLTYGTLLEAKARLRKIGNTARVFGIFDPNTVDVDELPAFLYAALITFQPEITFEEVVKLIDLSNAMLVMGLVYDAMMASMPKKEKAGKNEEAEQELS